jgi:hypothetical protein
MKQRILTKGENALILQTKINERALIIYVIESALADEVFPEDYQKALKDEIFNHKTILEEYKGELNKLK